ncbi:RNA-binding motif protein, X-linked 2-like [Paramacrobiotus metropolitanus]|uniref:RNA-binding motif protein, X-linked 2-like n=1 Tax=Paramacrobiotus metropolitanus TaxID=2943436 RepID=UPI0024457A47|nr:RNA-binding motif protein, X-linked 2-like [Paramacrobiotus metropolitanus]
MNPLTNTRKINELNEREARLNIPESRSWHAQYKDSAWIFIGGLPYEVSEGDVICVFSQYGEPVNINLIRDKKSGKSKGFCFLCYEDQRSTVLAVDNFNGAKLCGRTIRVDHVLNYKAPKEGTDDEIAKILAEQGCGPAAAGQLEEAVRKRERHETRTERDWRERSRSRSPQERHRREPSQERRRRDASPRPRRRERLQLIVIATHAVLAIIRRTGPQ